MGAMGTASFAGRIRLLCLAGVVVVGYGVVGYTWLGFNVVDAIYLTVSTLTTEGFTTPAPLSDGAKLFTVSLALLGVSVFVAVLGVLATALVDGQLVHKSRRWSLQRRITQLRDHHILCGYGRVGRAAARELDADGVPFVVIEVNPELENDLRRDGVLYLIGNSASEALLRAAGISRARGLVCAVDSDAESVYITRQPDLVDLFDLTRGGAAALRIEELLISEDSPLVGQTLAQVCGSATALLIRRAGGQLLPNPTRDTVIQSGDMVVIFSEPDALRPRE